MQVRCAKCSEWIQLSDVIESFNGRLAHVDCMRRRALTADERHLLFVYCSEHVVAQCLPCGLSYRFTELAADPFGGRTNICPRCRRDLTDVLRAHVYSCPELPAEVRLRAQEVREAARQLVKRSQELVDAADVLGREAEARLFQAQEALRAAVRNRSQH
jgi:hypothetical protein